MKYRLVRVYTKDLSLENPRAPAVFGEEWSPEVEMRLHAAGKQVEGGLVEATLQVSADARLGGQPAMVVEVVVAGLFAVAEAEEEEMQRALGAIFPAILYPYASETVAALSVRGGFPPLLLQPADFDELYRQRQAGSERPRGNGKN